MLLVLANFVALNGLVDAVVVGVVVGVVVLLGILGFPLFPGRGQEIKANDILNTP